MVAFGTEASSEIPGINTDFVTLKKGWPQVFLFQIVRGEISPYAWGTTGQQINGQPLDVQQWEFEWNSTIQKFTSVTRNGYGDDALPFLIIDPKTLQIVGGRDFCPDNHEMNVRVIDGDTLLFSEGSYTRSYGYIDKKSLDSDYSWNYQGFFSTEEEDTIQSSLTYQDASCYMSYVSTPREMEYFHTNSHDGIGWNADTILSALSERNTDMVRFVWWDKTKNPEEFVSSEAFRLGSTDSPFGNLTCLNPPLQINGGHHFRFLKKYGDTLLCTYFDNEMCDQNVSAKGILLEVYPYSKSFRVLNTIANGVTNSNGMGSFSLILDQDTTRESAMNAYSVISHGTGGGTMGRFVNLPALDTTVYLPGGYPVKEVGQVDIRKPGIMGPVFSATTTQFNFVGLPPYDIQIGHIYRADAEYLRNVPVNPIPETNYRIVGDSVEFYVEGLEDVDEIIWSNGATTKTMRILNRNLNGFYFARFKETKRQFLWKFSSQKKLDVTTGILNQNSFDFQMYPNPTSGLLHLEVKDDIILQIFNSLGILVSHQEMKSGLNQIDFSNFPVGIYFLQGKTENKTFTGKVIKN